MSTVESVMGQAVPTALHSLSYQTPTELEQNAVWAQGNLVKANDCTIFPQRCVGCNGNERLEMKVQEVTWAPSYAYFALLLGFLPGLLLALLLQRKAKLKMSQCSRCRRKMVNQKLFVAALFVATIGAFGLGIAFTKYFAYMGLGLLFAIPVYAVFMTRLYTVVSIHQGTVTLKGLSKAFISSLDQR